MTPRHFCLIAGLLAGSAAAQGVTVKIAPHKSNVLQFTIESKAQISTERKMLIDGEEMGRFGRGGGGPTKSTQKVVFEEGPSGTGWRNYIIAEAAVTRANRDGEDETTKITGALSGKKFVIESKDGRVVFRAKGADEALPRQITSGVPAKLNLRGLLPANAIEVGGEYNIDKRLVAALKQLMHPVRAARTPRGEGRRGEGRGGEGRRGEGRGGEGRGGEGRGGEGRGGEGRGGERGGRGGERGGRGGERGGRGGRGGRAGRFGRTPNTWNNTATRILSSKKLETTGTGQLLSVEQKDGQHLATLSIDADITGKGTPTELGLGRTRGRGGRGGGRAGRGGRGGRGGERGGGGQDTGEATVAIKVTGTVVVNQTQNRIETLSIKCSIKADSESKRTMGRGGEDREMVTKQSTKGSLDITVACADMGAAQEDMDQEDKDKGKDQEDKGKDKGKDREIK